MYDRILLDLDGVVVNFVAATLKLFRSDVSITRWDMPVQMGISNRAFYSGIEEAGIDFWANMDKYPWADELVETCQRYSKEIYFLSSPMYMESCFAGKFRWVRKHYPNIQLVLSNKKHFMQGTLIDDGEHNSPQILFPQPWNKSELSVEDVLSLIRSCH